MSIYEFSLMIRWCFGKFRLRTNARQSLWYDVKSKSPTVVCLFFRAARYVTGAPVIRRGQSFASTAACLQKAECALYTALHKSIGRTYPRFSRVNRSRYNVILNGHDYYYGKTHHHPAIAREKEMLSTLHQGTQVDDSYEYPAARVPSANYTIISLDCF